MPVKPARVADVPGSGPAAAYAVPVESTPDGWLTALESLVTIPDGYREETIDRVAALDLLRCGAPMLDELVRRGLPCSGPAGSEWFDRYDLFNLALYSGSGQSVPERAIQFALRWMSAPPRSWFDPMSWTFHVSLSCPLPGGCGPDPRWSLARPLPEAFGGQVLTLSTQPVEAVDDGVNVSAVDGSGLTITGTLLTRGEHQQVRSPVIREIAEEFLAAGHRWVRMPERLQHHPQAVLPRGVAPCISASLHLQQRLAAAGFRARTRRGWILGMLDLAHAWLEVEDIDGAVKPVDTIFAKLSTHARAPHPDFTAACVGSRINRLLPTGHRADQPLARHSCGGEQRQPRTKTMVRTAGRRADRPATSEQRQPRVMA